MPDREYSSRGAMARVARVYVPSDQHGINTLYYAVSVYTGMHRDPCACSGVELGIKGNIQARHSVR